MSANVPTDIRFSFSGFALRGGTVRPNADGWGIAFYDGPAARTFLDTLQCARSDLARYLGDRPIKSRIVIAHVRKANRGRVAVANTHPFTRELWGRTWTFDFARETTAGDVVTVIATRPLTRDERWTSLSRGQMAIFRDGEVCDVALARRNPPARTVTALAAAEQNVKQPSPIWRTLPASRENVSCLSTETRMISFGTSTCRQIILVDFAARHEDAVRDPMTTVADAPRAAPLTVRSSSPSRKDLGCVAHASSRSAATSTGPPAPARSSRR